MRHTSADPQQPNFMVVLVETFAELREHGARAPLSPAFIGGAQSEPANRRAGRPAASARGVPRQPHRPVHQKLPNWIGA